MDPVLKKLEWKNLINFFTIKFVFLGGLANKDGHPGFLSAEHFQLLFYNSVKDVTQSTAAYFAFKFSGYTLLCFGVFFNDIQQMKQ